MLICITGTVTNSLILCEVEKISFRNALQHMNLKRNDERKPRKVRYGLFFKGVVTCITKKYVGPRVGHLAQGTLSVVLKWVLLSHDWLNSSHCLRHVDVY